MKYGKWEFDIWKWTKRKKKRNVVFGYGNVLLKCKVVWVIFINRLMVSSSWFYEFEVECIGVQPHVNYDDGLVMCNQLVQKCGRHEKAESGTYKWFRSFEEQGFCLRDDRWSMKRGANCIVEGILGMSQFNHPNSSHSVVEEGRSEVDTELVPEFVDNEIVPELVFEPVGTKADTQERTDEGFGSESHTEVAIELAGHLFLGGNPFKSLFAEGVGGNGTGLNDTFIDIATGIEAAFYTQVKSLWSNEFRDKLTDHGYKMSIIVENHMSTRKGVTWLCLLLFLLGVWLKKKGYCLWDVWHKKRLRMLHENGLKILRKVASIFLDA